MNSLAILTDTQRLLLMALCTLASLFQFLALLLGSEERDRRPLQNAYEFAVLTALVCIFVNVASVHTHITVPNEMLYDLRPLRYTLLAPLLLLTFTQPLSFFSAGVFVVTLGALPLFELLPWYAHLLLSVCLLCALRAVTLCVRALAMRKKRVTRDAIAEALNHLPDALVFYAEDGHVLLANEAASELSLSVSHKPLHDAHAFWNALRLKAKADAPPGSDTFLYRDGMRTWSLTRRLIDLDHRAYFNIFAADVTELDAISRELTQLHDQLSQRAESLRTTRAHLAGIKREQEISRLQSRIHDVAGHRIYLLQQYIERSGSDLDGLDRFLPLISGLIDDLRADVTIPAARLLEDLERSFSFIGIDLHITGPLPQDERTAQALIKIVREAATNSVRHAGATIINVTLRAQNDETVMTVTDNGTPRTTEYHEGQGIAGMRAKLNELGGTLRVQTSPRFTLTATLPTPEENSPAP